MTICQGNFSTMGADVPAEIRRFGRQKAIHFVHFRDVRGTPENFQETFHEEGQTDMFESMRAYDDIGFAGPLASTMPRRCRARATTTLATRRWAASTPSATSRG